MRTENIKKTQEKNLIIFILDDPFHSLEQWCKAEGFYRASMWLCTKHLHCRHIFAALLKIFRLGSAVSSLIRALPYYVSDELCHSTPTGGFSSYDSHLHSSCPWFIIYLFHILFFFPMHAKKATKSEPESMMQISVFFWKISLYLHLSCHLI